MPRSRAATGTGVITGVVTGGSGGSPVRRARVMLSGPELRGGRSTVTNDQGQFTFSALPAGRFTMTASKAGYVDVPYGAKRPGRPGTPIQLAAGQKMEVREHHAAQGRRHHRRRGRRQWRAVARHSGPRDALCDADRRKDVAAGGTGAGRRSRHLPYLRTAARRLSRQRGAHGIKGIGDLRNTIAAEIEAAMQQMQAGGLGAALAVAAAVVVGGGWSVAAGGGGGGGGRSGRHRHRLSSWADAAATRI